MTSSVYTYVGNADPKNGTGAIDTVAGRVGIGQSGLFLPIEYQECLGEGLLLSPGPAKSPWQALTAPVLVAGSSGSPNGTYVCSVTFVTAAGETTAGPETIITVSSDKIMWSGIPVAADVAGVISRNLYRTVAGGASGTEKLVATIPDNTTTVYTDDVADGSLGAAVPAADTSFVITTASPQPSSNTPVALPLSTLDARYLQRSLRGVANGTGSLGADGKQPVSEVPLSVVNESRTAINDADYTVSDTDRLIAFTALSAPRFVTLPSTGLLAGRQIDIVDESGDADWYPVIVLGVLPALAAVLREPFGRLRLWWTGSQWSTDGWSAQARPPAAASGTTYYVSPSGLDTHDGLSPATAWKTVGKVNSVTTFVAGDHVLFEGGQTFSDDYLSPGASGIVQGTAADPIVFGSYSVGQAKLTQGVFFGGQQGDYWVFDNLDLDVNTGNQCIQLGTSTDAARHMVVQRCTLTQSNPSANWSPAVIAFGTTHQYIGNYCHDVGSHFIYAEPGARGWMIERNLVYNIGLNAAIGANQHHLYLNCESVTVKDNVLVSTAAQRAQSNSSSAISFRMRNSHAVGNHIANCADGIDFFQTAGKSGGKSTIVHNNLAGLTGSGIYVPSENTGDQQCAESFVIAENHSSFAPSANGWLLNLNPTNGTYEVWGNTGDRMLGPNGGLAITDPLTDLAPPRIAGRIYPWRARTSPNAVPWYSVCWSAELGLFCAVAYTGTAAQQIMTSPDGIAWTARTAPNAVQWLSVCWSAELGLFCAVAQTGTAAQQIMTSRGQLALV